MLGLYMAKKLKKVEIIGVSGARGSFSEEAARTYAAKNGLTSAKIEYLITVENVLASLEDGRISLGIFPIENSTGGFVIEALYAMAQHNFLVQKIFSIDIHQNLLVKKGVTAKKIKRIMSHDQAIKQCRMYLKRMWPDVDVAEYPDTAKAAADLSTGKLPASTAVIASLAAAKAYKLDVLEESIQDLKYNYTTFVAAKHK
jgi:prephenate dehydratase